MLLNVINVAIKSDFWLYSSTVSLQDCPKLLHMIILLVSVYVALLNDIRSDVAENNPCFAALGSDVLSLFWRIVY